MADFSALTTETRNLASEQIDRMSALEIATCINREDKTVALAVEKCLPQVAACIDLMADTLFNGGRIFYCGAGTSGRLGVVDAAEIPPTYGLYGKVIGMMAGGYSALINPAEDAEDRFDSIVSIMKEEHGYCEKDMLIAIFTFFFFDYGTPFTQTTQDEILSLLKSPHIKGLTLLGGEPMEPQNQIEIQKLLRRVKKELPEKDIWCYSGYTYEELCDPNHRSHCSATEEILSLIDILVDGKFVEEKKNLKLKFRGSENQRIIDVKKTKIQNEIVLFDI